MTMRVANNAKFNFPHLFKHNIKLGKLAWQYGDMGSLAALVTLCSLVKSGYEPVFEFGTYRGRTTYNLALNAAQVVTTLDWDNHEFPGKTFECLEGVCNVLRFDGDSRRFDYSLFDNRMGLVLVDGGHDYETCRSDTENAFRIVRPGGLIVWDDYNYADWPGVAKVIDEVAEKHDLVYFKEECLVIYGLQV